MNGFELGKVVEGWTGRKLDWNEEEIVQVGGQDGGELIEYFTNLVKKMQVAEVRNAARRGDGG